MGYRVLWTPEAWGREPFVHGGYLLAKTDQLIYATGIANIWARDPMTMACAAKTLAEAAEGRFILGIGVSHRSQVEELRGHQYDKPFSYMSEYIARMKQALPKAVGPKTEPPLVIAARILLSQGFSQTEFENGCSDRLIDTIIAWGTEEKIADRIEAHIAAGASHVCLMPLKCDSSGLPDERALEAFANR
jgi:alkanesulfonate monooxygenase SsuD/methylene tetrahydromethanopterin reductase-like flavin-dependent oxidoreductase (luciferase family)